MSNHLYQKNTIKRIDNKLKLLKSKYSTLFILNIRLFVSLSVLVLLVLFFDIGIVLGPILAIIVYYLFEYLFLDLKISKRIKKLNKEALSFFEMLLIALKKDSLLQALNNVASSMNTEISLSFRQVVNEVSLGNSLNTALDTLKRSLPSKEIRLLITSLQNTNMSVLIEELEDRIEVLKEKNALDNMYNNRLTLIKGNIVTLLFIIVFVLIVLYQLIILNLLG